MHKYIISDITQIRCSIKFQIKLHTQQYVVVMHLFLLLERMYFEIYHNNIAFGCINIRRGICNFIINHALLYVNVLIPIICRPVFNKSYIS